MLYMAVARQGSLLCPATLAVLDIVLQALHICAVRHAVWPAATTPAGLPVASNELRVMFAGKQLEDTDMLAECGVEDASTLHILMRLLGGAKKRKKKTYTKPKKQKHKHKKIKMRVLKFYKVSGTWLVQHCTIWAPALGGVAPVVSFCLLWPLSSQTQGPPAHPCTTCAGIVLQIPKCESCWCGAATQTCCLPGSGSSVVMACRWMTAVRCSACASSAHLSSAARASSWPRTTIVSTGGYCLLCCAVLHACRSTAVNVSLIASPCSVRPMAAVMPTG